MSKPRKGKKRNQKGKTIFSLKCNKNKTVREEITLQLHQETIKNLLIFYENDDASEAKGIEKTEHQQHHHHTSDAMLRSKVKGNL